MRRERLGSFIAALLALVYVLSSVAGVITSRESHEAAVRAFTPVEHDAFARSYLAKVQHGDVAAVRAELASEAITEVTEAAIRQASAAFPREAPAETRVIGVVNRVYSGRGAPAQRVSLSYQLRFSDRWVVATVHRRSSGDGFVVTGIQVRALPQALEVLHRPSLAEVRALHFIALLATLGVPAFIVLTVAATFRRERRPSGYVLWVLVALVGFGRVTFHWSTGDVFYASLINVFGAGFSRPTPYDPLILSTTLPLGALAFWLFGWRSPPVADQPTIDYVVVETTCPHCGQRHERFRQLKGSLICPTCHRSFAPPSDPPPEPHRGRKRRGRRHATR